MTRNDVTSTAHFGSFVAVDKGPDVGCGKEFTMKNNVFSKRLGGCIVLRLQESQSNRPVSWIKLKVKDK